MLVELATLKPNPYRDFTVDPIDLGVVSTLADSIEEDGFWGGVVCRQRNSHIEIAAGHHRVQAALQSGINVADVFVGELDDAAMIRVYARENATQRGNTGTAQAGAVASAVRFLAKSIATGTISTIVENVALSEARGNLTSGRGLGEPLILDFLARIPGITTRTIRDQLANLKASGDYARIIGEVQEDIEREEREAAIALARAEEERRRAEAERMAAEEAERRAEEERKAAAARARAAREETARRRAEEAERQAELELQQAESRRQLADKRKREAAEEAERLGLVQNERSTASNVGRRAANSAGRREITFDFEGVSKHLKNANQITAFRDVVTGAGMAPYLAVSEQAKLAAELVRRAQGDLVNGIKPRELSGAFIRENAMSLVMEARQQTRQATAAEQRDMADRDLRMRMRQYQDDFTRSVHGIMSAGLKITDLLKAQPNFDFRLTPQFVEAVGSAKKTIDTLYRRLSDDKEEEDTQTADSLGQRKSLPGSTSS
jgi:ParB-like nuclease domain